MTHVQYVEEDRGYDTPCWIWQGAIDADGYGKANNGGGNAHRAVYRQLCGSIPADRDLDHLCRERSCVNPDHMDAVPHKINTWRSANTKLSYEIAVEVREEYERWQGSQYAFCKHWGEVLGVCTGNVYKIVTRRSWVLPAGGW